MIRPNLSNKLTEIISRLFGKELSAVILYGSYAEGRETSYSDIDILIIINKDFADWREKRKAEIALRRETLSLGQISPKIMTPNELSSAAENFNPLVLNVLSSGKILYDTGIFHQEKMRFENIYGEKINKTKEGYWEVAT